jgi:hypothetical protein
MLLRLQRTAELGLLSPGGNSAASYHGRQEKPYAFPARRRGKIAALARRYPMVR